MDMLGLTITRQFTITLQPFIQNCKPRIRVLHADMQGIPITGFVASFEDQINQQLQFKTSDLPPGFVYCATSVQTTNNTLEVGFSATPMH